MNKRSDSHRKISAPVEADRVTKRLLQRLRPRRIAVIEHDDLDLLAAEGLIKAKTRAVVNAGRTMTGRLPLKAALALQAANIPLFEVEPAAYEALAQSDRAVIADGCIRTASGCFPCRPFTREQWLARYTAAQAEERMQLARFVDNTLRYAASEKSWLLEPLRCAGLRTDLAGRAAVVVIRGNGYKQDLAALLPYIRTNRPVLIGVDGGADALLEFGLRPALIVGDMDSVSDRALGSGAELVVHSYLTGRAPGLARLERLGLAATTIEAGGTSEDLALLLAYDSQCEPIVAIGLHSHMHDFAEKGRPGMGSSWLVRMKVGSRLVDARGLGRLYPSGEGLIPRQPRLAGWASFVKSLF